MFFGGNNFMGVELYLLMLGESRRTSEVELTKDLSESIFLLKKSSSSTASVQVDFSPLTSKEGASPCSDRALPTFNHDSHHFTPSFVLAMDQERYEENQELYSKIHDRKVNQISEQKSELLVPRPSKNNSYCCVCRVPFEDYLSHVNTPKHHYLIRHSDYNSKIQALCQTFEIKPQSVLKAPKVKRGRPTKTKAIQKILQKVISKEGNSPSTQVDTVSINA